MTRAAWMLAAFALSTVAVASALFVAASRAGAGRAAEPDLAAPAPQPEAQVLEPVGPVAERVAVPRTSESDGPAELGLLIRAEVVLRGTLAGAHGLGRELDIRVQPWWRGQPGLERTRRTRLAAPFAAYDDHWETIDHVELDPEDVDRVRETMIADGEPGLGVLAGADGSFARDVTSLLGGTRGLPDGLVLTVQHENFLPLSSWIPLVSGGAPIDAHRLELEGRLEIELFERLTPVCLLRGIAGCFDADCEVRVEAWALERDVPAGMKAEARVDPARREYALAVDPGRRYAVVALCDGYLPRTVIVQTWDQLDLWLEPLVLDHGARFAGRVDLARHTLGGDVWLYLSRGGPVLGGEPRYGREGLAWTGYEFAPATGAVLTHDEGRFEFEGLVPGRYELRIGIDREWWTEMDPRVPVNVPDEDALVPAPLARVELELEQGRAPLAGRKLRLQGLGRSSALSAELTTDRWGRAEAWLLGGEPYLVHVPMPSGPDWSYGKVVPHQRSEHVERISMGAWKGRD